MQNIENAIENTVENIIKFDFEDNQVRFVIKNGEPWFLVKDIAKALGYSDSSLEQMKNLLSKIPEEWAHRKPFPVRSKNGVEQVREMLCLSEQGVYFFLGRSDKPAALPFQKKVAGEIMPSIRKYGMYALPHKNIFNDPDYIIKIAVQWKEAEEHARALEEKINADKPKVIFSDSVAESNFLISIGCMAKILNQNGVNIGPNRFFERLREDGYLIKSIGINYNLPTQKSMDLELFKVTEIPFIKDNGFKEIHKQVQITGKGQVYFVNKYASEVLAS